MSYVNNIIKCIENGIHKFVSVIINANRDFPYHDYYHADETATVRSYVVGHNQVIGHGDQRKLFVSKSTLIYCTENTTIQFNSTNNVVVTILASTWYEFKSNISSIYHAAITQDKDLYVYFEGVLPNEARSPE